MLNCLSLDSFFVFKKADWQKIPTGPAHDPSLSVQGVTAVDLWVWGQRWGLLGQVSCCWLPHSLQFLSRLVAAVGESSEMQDAALIGQITLMQCSVHSGHLANICELTWWDGVTGRKLLLRSGHSRRSLSCVFYRAQAHNTKCHLDKSSSCPYGSHLGLHVLGRDPEAQHEGKLFLMIAAGYL